MNACFVHLVGKLTLTNFVFTGHREIGGAMMEFYNECIPKMEEYDVNVRVDVVGNMVIIGTQMNVRDLTMERHFLRFRNAVTIKVRLPESYALKT